MSEQNATDFEEGDRVRHPRYGHGTVKTARPGKLVVSYDTGGTGSEVAGIDKLEKLEEGDDGFVPWYENTEEEDDD